MNRAEQQRIDALELWCWRTLESPLGSKEDKSINPKGNQPWMIGRTDVEVEGPILWPPDVKSWLFRKDPDAGKDWRQEKGMAEDEMFRQHHWLNGHESEQTQGDSEGQGSLACSSPWGRREQDTTEQLNNNNEEMGPNHTSNLSTQISHSSKPQPKVFLPLPGYLRFLDL